MFLRSKVQEMILRRRSRSVNGGQHAGSQSTAACDGGKGRAPSFASPRLLHSSSLPAGGCAMDGAGSSPMRDSDAMAYSMSPTSVLDASAAFGPPADGGNGGKRRPWCDGCAGPHGLADALDCYHDGQERRRSILAGAVKVKAKAPALVRSCSLDRRVEFGVKNKSSWLPLRAGGRTAQQEAAAPSPAEAEMEPSSEDYTCVISRGPNPRTVHIFGDRVVEGDHRDTSPRQITNQPAPGDRGFLSL